MLALGPFVCTCRHIIMGCMLAKYVWGELEVVSFPITNSYAKEVEILCKIDGSI